MTNGGDNGTGARRRAAAALPTGGSPAPHTAGRTRRPSRWDRPKPPKDWHYWVGGFGRVLITLGLLLMSFVAYQLWGTGIKTAAAQNQIGEDFASAMARIPTVSTTTTVTPTSTAGTAPVTVPPGTAVSGSTVPGTAIPGTAVSGSTVPGTGPTVPVTQPGGTVPGSTPGGPTSTTIAGTAPGPEGQTIIGFIDIPRMGLDRYYVLEGVTSRQLRDGIGHFPGTPLPGQLGNVAFAGHRTSHGAPFGDLDELQPGDHVFVTTLAGRFDYLVTGTEVVSPNDYAKVIPSPDPSKATLAMITCHPWGTTRQRLVVHAELAPGIVPAPATPTPVPTAPSTGTPVTALTLPGETEGTATPGTGAAAVGTATNGTDPTGSQAAATHAAGEEFFSAGWFHDTKAWPHVALWALAIVGLAVLCYLLARSLRRGWVGWLVFLPPFLVLLYFWFENIERLLPPNI